MHLKVEVEVKVLQKIELKKYYLNLYTLLTKILCFSQCTTFSNMTYMSVKDFNYHFSNCMEITLRLSCCKYPRAFMLESEWLNNKESLLTFIEVTLTNDDDTLTLVLDDKLLS